MSRRNRNANGETTEGQTNGTVKPKKPRDPSLRYCICLPITHESLGEVPGKPLDIHATRTQAQKMLPSVARIMGIEASSLAIYKCVKTSTAYVKRERKAKATA